MKKAIKVLGLVTASGNLGRAYKAGKNRLALTGSVFFSTLAPNAMNSYYMLKLA